MRTYKSVAIIAVVLLLACDAKQKITIYLIGDSTCASMPENRRPLTGWGEKFAQFFDDHVSVRNHASSGRSTRTFIEENLWDSVLTELKSGDYVFIQFAHNDEVKEKLSYTTPEDFASNLKRFIAETRAKGAFPVLLTPVCRRRFENGNFYDTHGQYSAIARRVAKETGVDFIDMHTLTMAILVQYGEEKSRELFLQCAPGECPNYPEGVADNTHFSDFGATVVAEALAAAIVDSEIPLKRYAVRSPE